MIGQTDLFGDPVPANRGRRGRPEHVATQENCNKVNMFLSLGYSNLRIAGALRISLPTLLKHYSYELRYRDVARDRMNGALAMKLWEQVQAGNVPGIREFMRFVEQSDVMLFGPRMVSAPVRDDEPVEPIHAPMLNVSLRRDN